MVLKLCYTAVTVSGCGGRGPVFLFQKTEDRCGHTICKFSHSMAFPTPLLPPTLPFSLAPAGASYLGGTANGGRDTSRKTLRALTSIFSASVHACWPWPLGKVHRSNSCCMYLTAENKMAGKLPSPWSRRMEKEPPDSVFLLASITNLGVSAHHAILRFLTESQTGLPAMCPELFVLRFFVETCWV